MRANSGIAKTVLAVLTVVLVTGCSTDAPPPMSSWETVVAEGGVGGMSKQAEATRQAARQAAAHADEIETAIAAVEATETVVAASRVVIIVTRKNKSGSSGQLGWKDGWVDVDLDSVCWKEARIGSDLPDSCRY